MGEVLCTSRGDVGVLKKWVEAKEDRFLVWAGEGALEHERVYAAHDNELVLQQIASELIYLPFVYEDEHPVLKSLARIQSEIHLRVSDYADQGVKLLSNFRANLHKPFARAQECRALAPVIICGAGSSLQEFLPLIREMKEYCLIMGCGAGMQALLAAGIKPHVAVQIDPDPHHVLTVGDIPLFFQLRTGELETRGPRFLMAGTGEFLLEKYIEERLGVEGSVDGGWNAVCRGSALAEQMGCREIYFAGVDLKGEYAKGVSGSERYDWQLAAEWLNERGNGYVLKKNPLMPALAVGVPHVGEKVSFSFEGFAQRDGKEVWEEIRASFAECTRLIDAFMERFQKVFPHSPLADAECLQILCRIDEQLVVRLVLDAVWSTWEVVMKRADSSQEALAIHRILILKTLAERFDA